MSTEEFLFRIAADTKELREELKKARAETGIFTEEMDKANTKGISLNTSFTKVAKGVGIVATAVTAAAAAFSAYTVTQARAARETEIMARMAGLSVEEFRKLSFVMGTVGIDADSVGDLFADAQEKIGDFLNTGGGGFQDFIDTMGYTKEEATALAREFERMSGQEVLQEMVNRMEEAGVSSQRMNHALEGMASEARRLIPLLSDNGAQAKALGETFDSINVPLTAEERAQFTALADNVDLAQTAFVNFLNNAIAPFLPAINSAATALAEFFASAQAGMDLNRIVDDNSLVEQIDTLAELDRLQEQLGPKIDTLEEKLKASPFGRTAAADRENLEAYREAAIAIDNQREAIEARNAAEQEALDLESKKGNLKSSTGGIGAGGGAAEIDRKQQLLDELAAEQDAQKNRLELLKEERAQRFEILSSMFDEERELTAAELRKKQELSAQIETNYLEQVADIAKTDEQRHIEQAERELSLLESLNNEKLISQEDYEARRREIIENYNPTSLDPEKLEEKNQAELEALNEQLANHLVSYENYYSQLSELQKKDTADKKKKQELENWWSESSVKKQIDLGTTLLTSLGNNSKKQHKIQQGLSAANAGMNTAEGVTKALSKQDYAGAAYIGLTGAAQIAAIWASTPDGKSSAPSSVTNSPVEAEPVTFNEQTATATDISAEASDQTVFRLEFSDEVIDAFARKIDQAKGEGRV